MLQSDALDLTRRGEGATLEFERGDVRPEQLAKEIVAFANMSGGTVLLGVGDDGQVEGIGRKNLQTWLLDAVIGKHVRPFILPTCEEFAIEGKPVAAVQIPMGIAKPYALRHDGREDVYLRYDDTCRLASRETAARMFHSGGHLAADRLPVHGSSLADLDRGRYARYFVDVLEALSRQEMDAMNATDLAARLAQRELMHQAGDGFVCTVAGMALFGRYPSKRLPQASVRLNVFPGSGKSPDSLVEENISGPLVGLPPGASSTSNCSLPEWILTVLRQSISRYAMKGMRREREWDFPAPVIRELVVNAFAHRDWTRNTDIEISVYSDRMEVVSPGALPNGMTVEKVISGQRVPRNNNIVNVLRDYGLMKHLGMGVRRTVMPLMRKHNNREPQFEATEDFFKVILWKKPAS